VKVEYSFDTELIMTTTSQPTTQRVAIILNGPNDWDEWIGVVKSKAIGTKIWEYINPSTAKAELSTLTEPNYPLSSDVNPAKTDPDELSGAEKEQLKRLQAEYKRKISLYERQETALGNMRTFIQETISRTYLTYTLDCETSYDMLVELKQRIAPTDRAREAEMINKYSKLKKAPKSQSIDHWLREWEKVYTECKLLDLPDVSRNRSLFDFLNAIASISPGFSDAWMMRVQEKQDAGETLPDLYKIVELFRNNRRLVNAQKGLPSHSAFPATYQGKPLSSSDNTSKTDGKPTFRRPCLCGIEHQFKDCPYIVESIRTKDWKPDPAIQKQIDEKLEDASPRMKTSIKWARKRASKKQEGKEEQKEESIENASPKDRRIGAFHAYVFTTSISLSTDYHLRDSFLLDTAANAHVCNNRAKVYNLRPATEDDFLYAGNTVIPIEGFGSVDINVKIPSGSATITLLDTALVPSFHTSVVSMDKFLAKKVYWDMEHNRLTHNKQTFCYVERNHGQWTLENNEPMQPTEDENAIFATRSARPRPDEQASPEKWHLKLGHAGPEAISHLSEAATGVKLIRGPSTTECETCSVSKATRIISRRASPRGTNPYERVCWDLIQMSKAYNGDKWISHMRCDRTCMNHIYTQRSKKQSLPTMQRFVKWVYRRYGCEVKIIRLDGETSMLKGFEDWAAEEGITIERSSPYTPAQNGVAERSGGVIIQKSRCIRIGAQLPEELWPETGKTSGYLLNRSPTKQLEWRTPLEQLYRDIGIPNPQPDLSHLKVFGCRAYPVIPSAKIPKTRKLLPRAHIGYLVGYESTNIFRIWVPSEMKVIKTRDVTFNEELFYAPNETDLAGLLREQAEQFVEVVEIPSDSASLTEHLDLDSDLDIDCHGLVRVTYVAGT
jgi:hypothetical protein